PHGLRAGQGSHGDGPAARRTPAIVVARARPMKPAPTFPEDFNLADYYLFDRLREDVRDRAAVLFGERRYTYAEIADKTRALRSWLALAGVAREERVLIVLHDTPAFAWAFFATLHHGAVVTMGNPEAPPADLAYLVEYTRATAIITIPRVAE